LQVDVVATTEKAAAGQQHPDIVASFARVGILARLCVQTMPGAEDTFLGATEPRAARLRVIRTGVEIRS
jgi:hypothetical protein